MGIEWVVPGVGIATLIGNAAIAWAAVRRGESRVDDHDERIRTLETDVAVIKATHKGGD